MIRSRIAGFHLIVTLLLAVPATADPFHFQTDPPDGRMAMASQPSSAGTEIEAADDFLINVPTTVQRASFTGLLTGAAPTIGQVVVEIYRIFPNDSNNPPSGNVPTRNNSPSDIAFAPRDSAAGGLTFTTSLINATFTASNSVLNGIHPVPNQTTGGDGAVTGQEVTFNVIFNPPLILPAGHYFFVPQVQVTSVKGNFYWLSSTYPGTGSPFSADLQTWIRDANLAPDWLRVGTDIVGGNPAPNFNASFSLDGDTAFSPAIPTLSTLGLLALSLALGGVALLKMRKPRRAGA